MTTDFQSHFALHSIPFTRELQVSKHFRIEQYNEVQTALLACVERRMSAALIAPAGTGKSQLVRALLGKLPEARYRTHYVKVTNLSKRDMCREIAAAMDVAPAGAYPFLVRRIQERLQSVTAEHGLRPVLVLDEAHEMRPDVLGLIRVLTNFDMDSKLVVSVLLVGQPRLRNLLRRDDLEDIARRLSHITTLRPLTPVETGRYLEHRLNIAGASATPFATDAVEAIFEIGRGNLRATDRVALKAMEVAWQQGSAAVDANHAIEARQLLWP